MNASELLTTLFDPATPLPALGDYAGPRIETRPGQTLYDATDPITDVFVVLSGRFVLLTADDPPRPLLRLRGPAITGDAEVIASQATHLHAARCLDRCEIAILPANSVAELAASAVAQHWLRDLAVRHQRTLATITAEAHPLEDRLCRWLWDTFGDGPFEVPPDRDLALHLQISEDRAGRARRALEKTGRLGAHGVELKGPHAELMAGSPLVHTVKD